MKTEVDSVCTEYLVSYGLAGTLGRFVAELPDEVFERGAMVEVLSDRGKEKGRVLRTVKGALLPVTLRHIPGKILRLLPEAAETLDRPSLWQKVEAFLKRTAHPVQILELEIIDEPTTLVLHLLQLREFDIRNFTSGLSKELALPIVLENLTKEEESCGSGGCGSGGCSTGGCKSKGKCGSGCGSNKQFANQWKDYFAERRKMMETRRVALN